MNTVFVFTNRKQMIGAKVAKFALEKHRRDPASFTVEIVEDEATPAFQNLAGTRYLFEKRTNEWRIFSFDDLQSFTLTRFMPPAVMGYQGRASGIDPDIFALTDVTELFDLDLAGHAVAGCRKKDAWDSSVILMDCEKLRQWDIEKILADITIGTRSYMDIMTLKGEDVQEIPRSWNSLDSLTPDTKMLHTTTRLTQPWKTGLPIDFTRNKMPKYFGVIPREPIHKLLGKYPTRYQPHPDPAVEHFFFSLLKESVAAGAVSDSEIAEAIREGNVRVDLRTVMASV